MSNHGERTEPQQRLGKVTMARSVTMVKFSPVSRGRAGQSAGESSKCYRQLKSRFPWVAAMCACKYMYPNILKTMAERPRVRNKFCVRIQVVCAVCRTDQS